MKSLHVYFVIAFLTLDSSAFADDQPNETLFSEQVTHGGFGGPQFKISPVNGSINYFLGGKGAWLVDHSFYLGGGGFGMLKRTTKNGEQYDFGYGGLLLGYIATPSKLWHFGGDVLLGMGGVNKHDMNNMNQGESDSMYVVEPTFYATLNLTRFAEFNVGFGYRYVHEFNSTLFSSDDLSGWVINTNVMFGKF